MEITNYNKKSGEIYANLNCLYISDGGGKNLLELLKQFLDLRYLYTDRNLSLEERRYMEKEYPECEIG